MAITYEKDDAEQLVYFRDDGPFRLDQVLQVLDRIHAEGTWSYRILYDARLATGHPDIDELRRIFAASTQAGPETGRGPMAIVVLDQTLYGMMCAYAALCPPGRVEVFRDRTEARRWLDTTR